MSWQKCSLGELFEIKHGFAFKGKFFSDSGEKILLTPGNFFEDGGLKLKGDKEKYYIGEYPAEYLLDKGELLVAMTDLTQNAPILGSPLIIPDGDIYLHNQRLGKIINLDVKRVDKIFLYYLLNTRNVREQIKASATGATVKHTAPSRIYDVEVKLPSLNIQKEIAGKLLAYDDLIENNNRRIQILETIAQKLYQEWFVYYRFPGHEQTQWQDTEQGKIPAGWEVKKLKDVCNLTMGQSPKSEFYNELGEGVPFFQGVRDFGQLFPTANVWCTKPTRFAKKDDILFSVRAPVGRLNIAGFDLSIGRGLCAINHKESQQAFLYQQIKSIFTKEDMMGGGTIFNSVTKSDMESIQLICPPSSLVREMNAMLQPIFKSLGNLSLKNENLKQQRDLLLSKLIKS